MAGFRLWENVTIEQLLERLTLAALSAVQDEYGEPLESFEPRLRRALKQVLNNSIYASPACGTSSLCAPSEEGRAKPWSSQSASWGLVSMADSLLDRREE